PTKLPVVVQPPNTAASPGPVASATDTRHSFCRRSAVRTTIGVPGRYSTILRLIRRSASKNGGSGPSAAFIKEDQSPWVFGAVVKQHMVFWRARRNQPTFPEPFRQLSLC